MTATVSELLTLVFFASQYLQVSAQGNCLLQIQADASVRVGLDGSPARTFWNQSMDLRDSAFNTVQTALESGTTGSEMMMAAQGALQNQLPTADHLQDDWKARGYSAIEDYVKYASIATLILLVVMVVWVRSQDSTSPQKVQSSYSSMALCQMQAFRWYAGFFVMAWLPYLIAQEGERMWGRHQAAFMSICKLIFGLSIVATPLFGALNDRTRLKFGRRRAWFFAGAVLIIGGICGTALSSLSKTSSTFFVCLTFWMFGEAACESTSEALVPDLCSKEDFSRAGGFKSSLFSLGGIFGYVMIIICGFTLRLPFYWMYLAFLFCIVLTAPFVFAYTAPTEAEAANLDAARAEDKPMLQTLWYSYFYPLQGPESLNFLKAIVASSFYCAGASSVLFILLVCRDILKVETSEKVQLHFACVSLNFSAFAVVGALVATAATDSVNRLYWGKLIGALYGVTELLIPACGYLANPVVAFYIVSSFKGMLYGNILSMFYSLLWDVVPAKVKELDASGHDHVADAMAVASVGRSLGAGLGNAICGMVLQFAFSSSGASGTSDDDSAFHYPLQAYFAMFSVSALSIWIGSALLQTIRLPESK